MLLDANFWLAFCFIIFSVLLYKPAKRMILLAIDKRISTIKEQIEEACTIKTEAENLLIQTEHELGEANIKASDIIKEAEITSKSLMQNKSKELDVVLARKRKEFEHTLAITQQLAVVNMKNKLVELSHRVITEYMTNTDTVSDERIASNIGLEAKLKSLYSK